MPYISVKKVYFVVKTMKNSMLFLYGMVRRGYKTYLLVTRTI